MKTSVRHVSSWIAIGASCGLALLAGKCIAADAESGAIAILARAGVVEETTQNSDEFIWRLFVGFVTPVSKDHASPVQFETWASDADTFSNAPKWPEPNAPKRLRASVLSLVNSGAGARSGGPVTAPPKAPGNAAVGGFPSTGATPADPPPVIAEEVRRNRPMFDYIVGNHLNNRAGLAAAYASSMKVEMPTTSVAVKGDWVPVPAMLRWIPEIGSLENLHKLYYTGVSDGVEYALVALHVSSRQNPNWVWGTFEHFMNPGRADEIGSCDTFGAVTPVTRPNLKAINTQYGPSPKTPALLELMAKAHLSPVWNNYCLKSTQVDFVAPDGTPYALGNSVIERIVGNGTVAASSCITCHFYASFGKEGKPLPAATAMLPYNPFGRPIPAVLDGSLQFAFMWGVLQAP